MQFSTSVFMALAAIIPFTSAHMRVTYPPVYRSGDQLPPLEPDGSNYPCSGSLPPDGAQPTYEAGTSNRFVLGGSAVHGGGSCQISITYDVPVRKDSRFYVLKSFHGDCPTAAQGNLDENGTFSFDLPYHIPSNMPKGPSVLAWTWFNRVGNREMYMRCAPVTINSGTTDHSALKALPPMFKANVLNIGADSCILPEGSLFRFPNPGNDVHTGSGLTILDVPPACGSSVVAPSDPEPTYSPEPEPTYPAEPEIPTTSLPADAQPTEDLNVIAPPANPPQGGDEEPATPVDEPVPTVTVVPVEPETPKTPETPVKPIPSSGRCNEDGAIICTSSSTWAVCDHGAVVPMGNVADGMVCKGGAMEFAKSKGAARGMKYGHQHRRRHHKRAL